MSARWQDIKYDRADNAYITHYHQRYNLRDFIRPSTALNHRGLEVHGLYCVAIGLSIGIHIAADGKQAKVFYLV